MDAVETIRAMDDRDTAMQAKFDELKTGIEAFKADRAAIARDRAAIEQDRVDLTRLKNALNEKAGADLERLYKSNTIRAASTTIDQQELSAKQAGDSWFNPKTGDKIPVLGSKDLLGSHTINETGVGLGQWLRGVVTGGRDDKELVEQMKSLSTAPDASGGYTVPAPLAAEFIDRLRAEMVLNRAGVRTVPMTSKTLSMARVEADATIAWHAENALINASDPTFGAATLTAHTVLCLVKMSLELSQDSVNINEILSQTITRAMAVEIDRAGLMSDGGDDSPTGVANFSNRNTVTGIGGLTNYDKFIDGIGKLLNENVPLSSVGPIVIGTQAWTDLAKTKDDVHRPLIRPPELTMPFLTTTGAQTTNTAGEPTGSTGFVANWADLLFGIRQDISIRILSERFLGDNLQVGVLAYARCDFQPARAASFCTLEGITH
jgi:HK97 family phage major capsid protein